MSVETAAILVADDDADVRMLVAAVLRSAGYVVALARDGREAVEIATDRVLRGAVLDITMPRMSGLEVCRTLRDGEATRHLPIVLLSSLADQTDVERGYSEGASRYMPKPFKPRELLATMRALVN